MLLLSFSLSAQTVYKTKTGKKYHTENCKYLSKSKIQITLEEAIKSNLEPCSVCISKKSSADPKSKPGDATVKPKPKPTSTQCIAITKKGERCKRKAKEGSSCRWQHDK